jgi:hypothetical protein
VGHGAELRYARVQDLVSRSGLALNPPDQSGQSLLRLIGAVLHGAVLHGVRRVTGSVIASAGLSQDPEHAADVATGLAFRNAIQRLFYDERIWVGFDKL